MLTYSAVVTPETDSYSGALSKPERKAYTDAVLCLQSKPAKTPASVSSGARSRVCIS